MTARAKLQGLRFGRVVVIDFTRKPGDPSGRWEYVCDCGKTGRTQAGALTEGRVKSCGCLNVEHGRELGRSRKKHGMCDSPEYRSWRNMLERCSRPNNKYFHAYGARGITVCDEWRTDFAAFFSHIGPKPPATSIERIDNNRGYEPGNVKWATSREQANNRRSNTLVEFDGRSMTIAEFAREHGLSQSIVQYRASRGETGDVLARPVKRTNRWPS